MAMNGRQRLILCGTLVAATLLILSWPNNQLPISSPSDPVAFFLMIAGVIVLGICIAKLVTGLWLENRIMHVLALAFVLLVMFIASSYFASLGKRPWDTWTPIKLLANISGSYLLVACWASFANAIDKPFTRSQAMVGGALANLLIGFIIILELNIQGVVLTDQVLTIIVVVIISASLAWTSALEVEEAERSSNKWIGTWRAIQAIFFTFIGPLLILFWVISTIGFSA